MFWAERLPRQESSLSFRYLSAVLQAAPGARQDGRPSPGPGGGPRELMPRPGLLPPGPAAPLLPSSLGCSDSPGTGGPNQSPCSQPAAGFSPEVTCAGPSVHGRNQTLPLLFQHSTVFQKPLVGVRGAPASPESAQHGAGWLQTHCRRPSNRRTAPAVPFLF